MLLVSRIREEKEAVQNGLRKRAWSEERIAILDEVVNTDDKRKKLKTELDHSLSSINKISSEIGGLFKAGKREEAEAMKSEVSEIKTASKALEIELKETEGRLEDLLLTIPNIPDEKVPEGKTEDDNAVFLDWDAEMPSLPENALPHWELMEKYNIVDLKLGVKITGAGFPLYRGKGAKLQRALINFFIDEATKAGYEEVQPPLLVNEESGRGTGNLPDKEGQMYHMEKDDLYLIPTAEVPLTNMYRGDIIDPEDLPLRMCGYTPCFRREAGSYGAHVKGLNRVHQFDKIEIVEIHHPDNSAEAHIRMLEHVKLLLKKLELPYRILTLCGGDLTFASSLTYDFEVYSAAQKQWLEVSSVSNFKTYQSNRMKLRYRDEHGKTQLAHTLNGSALALARIFASLLENNQTEDGIVIPEALRNYTGFDIIN